MSATTTKKRSKPTNEEQAVTEKDRAFTDQLLAGAEAGPEHAAGLKAQARKRLEGLRLPRTKDEEWRFVRLRPITETDFEPADAVDAQVTEEMVADRRAEEAAGQTLVFVNGRFSEQLSELDGVGEDLRLGRLSAPEEADRETVAEALGRPAEVFEDDYFANVNTAGFRDGAYVIVPSDTSVEDPVQIIHVATESDRPYVAHPRNLVVVGDHSKLSVVEDYMGPSGGVYLTNPLTEVAVGDGATLEHGVIQAESDDAFHIHRRAIDLEDGSTYDSRTIAYGATFSRFDVHSRGDGEEIDCTLDGLAVLRDDQVSDTHSVMDHRQGHSGSHQLHKMILEDKAHSVFNGKIFVQPHAQKIDAYQLNRTLLLSEKAKVNTKPQLEIFADDVSCTHGATIGQLEEDQLFYLQTRGIDEQEARELLIYGFAAEILDGLSVESVHERVARAIATRTRGGTE